jgi:pimeloyl-ACP methyl ester carboxylesterase
MRALSGPLRHLPEGALRLVIHSFIRRGHDDREVAEESFAIHVEPYRHHGAAQAFARQVQALDVQDTLAIGQRLRDWSLPTRVVWGAADQFQKIGYGQRFADDLQAPLAAIDGGKHFVPEDHPEAVVSAIRELLVTAQEQDEP